MSTYPAKKKYTGAEAQNYEEARQRSFLSRLIWDREFAVLNQMIQEIAADGNRITILDIPAGTGRFIPLLLQHNCRVVGADISLDMLNLGRHQYESDEIHFSVCDAERLPFKDNVFDYVLSIRFMGHVPTETRPAILREMVRVSRKGIIVGYPILNPLTWTKYQLGNIRHRIRTGLPRPWWPVTPKSLKRELLQANVQLSVARPILIGIEQVSILILEKQ